MSWNNGATFGHDIAVVQGLVEGSWGMNLELIALRFDGQIQHYFRGAAGWVEGPVIGPA
jgi:hypothetical protein